MQYPKKIYLLFLLILPIINHEGNVINVPDDFATIQQAINASVDGDTVLVAPGTYKENINFKKKNIHVASHFILDGDRDLISQTIVDGSSPKSPDTASCVIIISGETRDAILEGFTLTKGKGTKWLDEHGAGWYTEGGGVLIALSSPTIRNNIITNNLATKTGSGIVSAGGGGIRLGDGEPLIEKNIVINNKGMYGGGIVVNYASPIVRSNIIAGNSVYQASLNAPTFGGGGIWTNGSGLSTIYNNTIVNNSSKGTITNDATGNGGGILLFGRAVFENNIVWGNTQDQGKQFFPFSPTTAKYSCIEDGDMTENNITDNPKFTGSIYELADDSPCIDAGNPDISFNDVADPSNQNMSMFPSKGTVRNDMGAYGGPYRIELSPDPTEVADAAISKDFSLYQNYPNPFNPGTTIKFGLKHAAFVHISVFNTLGQEVDVIASKEFSSGSHTTNYIPNNLATGIYFYTMSVNDRMIESKKLVFIK